MNKITKLLSVFALAGALGAGIAGAAGCKHKHTYEDKWTPAGAEGHYHVATCHPEEHDEVVAHGTANSEGKCPDCGYQLTTPKTNYVVAADVTGLLIEGVTSDEIDLSAEKKSHTIDKSAIKVYFATGANADVKGTEVPAENLVLDLKDASGAAVSSWENIKTDGVYKVNASLKDAEMATGATVTVDDLKATATVTINNPVTAIALKSGATLTQKQSATNSMTPTWKFEITYQNTEKEDVTADKLDIGVIDIINVGADKTVDVKYKGTEVKTTVTYSVTKNDDIHFESTGYVFGISDLASTIEVDTEYKQGQTVLLTSKVTDGKNKVTATSGKVDETELTEGGVTKKFFYRYQFGGGTFGSNGKIQKGDLNRWLDVTTTGGGLLTVYYATNGSVDSVLNPDSTSNEKVGRGIGVYAGDMKDWADTTCLGRDVSSDKFVHKLTVAIPAAGTYHIATANEKDVYFLGMQLDNLVETAGDNVGLPTATQTTGIELTVNDTEADGTTKKALKVGQNFESWVTGIKTVDWNPVSANVTRTAVSDISAATYTIKSAAMADAVTVTSATALTADMLGECTVTVTLGEHSDTYTATVESAVDGITGITAALKSTVKPQVNTATDKFTLTKDMVEVKTKETVDGATVQESSIVVKYNNEDIGSGVQLAVLDTAYVITVEATVDNGTATASFTTTFNLKVSVKPDDGSLTASSINFNGLVSASTDAIAVNTPLTSSNITGTSVTAAGIVINGDTNTYHLRTCNETVDGENVTVMFHTKGACASEGDPDIGKRWLELTLAEAGTYNITVYAKAGGDGSRYVVMHSGKSGATVVKGADLSKSEISETTFTNVECGTTVKIASGGNAIQIYKVVITPVS